MLTLPHVIMKIYNFNQLLLKTGIVLLVIILSFQSCKKDDEFDTSPSIKLNFSSDSILFDTIFTTIGSITKQLKVYNPSSNKIKISNIQLAGGYKSFYRINIDGNPDIRVTDIELAAKDSLYIFIHVTIDPNNTNNPMVVTDQIIFETNGNMQDVDLVAWGQDAHFYYYNIISANYEFTNDKPHVIYGYVIVDSAFTLTIEEGTNVYMHSNSFLYVYRDGTLKINGTLDKPVKIQGDRLENFYKDIPGQWNRIWLSALSIDNEINYAIIRNGIMGVQVDTVGNSTNPTLRINNTIIDNMLSTGIYAQGSHVEATNCVITSCGQYAIVLSLGGEYDFRHCTVGNYYNYSSRETPSLVLNNYYEDINGNFQVRPLEKVYFGNCIIYGSNEEEILLDNYSSSSIFNYTFDHCLLRTKISNDSLLSCIKNEDPMFVDYRENNYKLQENSPAIGAGIPIGVPQDIEGVDRGAAPDIGAYQYIDGD